MHFLQKQSDYFSNDPRILKNKTRIYQCLLKSLLRELYLKYSNFDRSCIALEHGVWIAGTDQNSPGKWVYYDDDGNEFPVGFLDWDKGKPSGREHCLELYLTQEGPYAHSSFYYYEY